MNAVVADVPVPYRVLASTPESSDVVTLEVAPLDGPLPPFAPAQFAMIGVAGIGEVPISISSATAAAHRYTLRRAGAVTGAVCDARPGDVVTVRGPFGRPWDLDRAAGRPALFVAGGIGLAPLRAAIEAVVSGRHGATGVSVLVGARSPDDHIFAGWLDGLARRRMEGTPVTVALTVDGADTADRWSGPTGPVTDLLAPEVAGGAAPAVFVCGPDAMMAATLHRLGDLGIGTDSIQLTLERNMHCANGWCGHCQLGPILVCRDGPVVDAARIGRLLEVAEL